MPLRPTSTSSLPEPCAGSSLQVKRTRPAHHHLLEKREALSKSQLMKTTDYWVVGLAPVADFDDMYKILLTEKPAHFQWAAGNNDKLFWFQVSSRNEPIGHN